MKLLSLILRIVAIIASIAACTLYFLSEDKLEEQKQEIAQVRVQLQALSDEKETAILEAASLREKLSANASLLEEGNSQVEEVQAELAAAKQESIRLKNKLEKAEREFSNLKASTDRLRSELINAEESLAAASQEGLIAQLNERIEKLTSTNNQLREEIRMLVDGQSGPLVNADENAVPKFTVQTLSPNQARRIKEETKIASLSISNGIVVLDAKSELDLEPGSTIQLVKGLEILAEVKIVNLNDSLAIANILPGAKLEGLAKGDVVKILR